MTQLADNLFDHNYLEETGVFKMWRVDERDKMKDSDTFNMRGEEFMRVMETALKYPVFREAAKNILIAAGVVRDNHS